MSITNFDNYIAQYKKIYIHQLNSDPYVIKQQTNNGDGDGDVNVNVKDESNKEDEKYELYHLNIDHLDSNNNMINNNYYSEHETNNFVQHFKQIYLDQSNTLKKNEDVNKYKIISETCKIELDKCTIDPKTLCYVSTTLLNQSKLYDGMTHMDILTNPSTCSIASVKIRTRAKSNLFLNPTYRDIVWNLEFEEYDHGYKILGLDNFIHISLIGLEEIFLDIEFDAGQIFDPSLNPIWLKFDRLLYNQIIKTNLAKHLYENDESYSVDIVDWIVRETIDIKKEEQMFGNIYGTNYNILRMMSGLGGLSYSN